MSLSASALEFHAKSRIPLEFLHCTKRCNDGQGASCRFEATVRKDVTSSLRTRQEILNREPDLAKLMLWVYGDSDWLYPDTAPGPLSGGQAPSHHMKRVPVQQLRRQLAGEGAAPGFLGGIAEGNSGVGASGGSGREPGLGGITQSLDGGGLQGQFMGKMKELKGFAKGFFS